MGGSFKGSTVLTNTSTGARRFGSPSRSNLMDKRSKFEGMGTFRHNGCLASANLPDLACHAYCAARFLCLDSGSVK
ncbi:Cellulose synthase A catalytic subunit 7 [UDP-forming] [Senna tora]|uniref:Cellulose synthase A catalytic subunit 7 [UDP-forming] n=1 Tax=Senna tora TaxID=362788 RepID=A0A835CK18_9FABA|nr:Cellulose synthase A catalytic subunit 7 [UDP-forming] [Senna tora]